MLGRHGDDKPADAPGGECLQYAVVGLVKPPELQKGIDSGGKQAERRQIPRRSRFCGGQVLQYIYIHRSVVLSSARWHGAAEGRRRVSIRTGRPDSRIAASDNRRTAFNFSNDNGKRNRPLQRVSKPRTMCSEKTAGGAAPDGMCDLAESNQKRYSLSSEKEKSLGRSPLGRMYGIPTRREPGRRFDRRRLRADTPSNDRLRSRRRNDTLRTVVE